MIQRTQWNRLSNRTVSAVHNPLLLMGAGSTGKKTLAWQFSSLFSDDIVIDLEAGSDSTIFTKGEKFDDILKAIFFLKNKDLRHKRTLIFLHEIQNCPAAFAWFLDSANARLPFHIMASCSMRTPMVNAHLSNFKGKKTDILYIQPFTFEEFLKSIGDETALEAFQEVPVPVYAYEKLLHYFHLYSLIGGMPEIVSTYAATRQLTGLRTIYERLLSSMILQINRHTKGVKHCAIVEDTLQNSFPFAATRIKFNQFGNSRHRTREMGEAFRTLEQHLLLHLLYPSTSTHFAASMPDREKSPRLQLLDTGLVNYFSGIQKALFQSQDMNAIFEGQIARQVVGQEILASQSHGDWEGIRGSTGISEKLIMEGPPLQPIHFWVRDKAQSTAEVDFVIPFNDLLIPVSVKSGEPGRLRSLHQFIDLAPHAYAVRLYAGKLAIQQAQTLRGKKYYLLSLPYFLAGKITDHLKGFIRLTNG